MLSHQKFPIILDTDPGIDDAVAIAAALFHPNIDLQLITTVAGNVSVEKTTNNALKLLHFFGKTIPVAKGAASPLVRSPDHAEHIHGHSGMDGYTFESSMQSTIGTHAVEAMHELLATSRNKLTLVTIGPLTNIALLLLLYPESTQKIERIILMGGSASRGNHTPNAEFNICVDPEAAAHVFKSGIPLVMCGLDVTNKATLTAEMMEKIAKMNKTGEMFYHLFQHYRDNTINHSIKMHDLCAIAYLVKQDLFSIKNSYVAIETQGVFTAGTTCVDLSNRWGQLPNTTVCLDIDVERFRHWFMELMTGFI